MTNNPACNDHSSHSEPRLHFAQASPFARSLRTLLAGYTATPGISRFAASPQWTATIITFLICSASFGSMLRTGPEGPTALWLGMAAMTGFAAFMLLVLIGHDAAHGSASPRRWINDALVFGIFAILGVSGALWRDRHLRLHHLYPNLPGSGIDADSTNVLRLAPDKPLLARHRFQPIYALPIYALGLAALVWFEDPSNLRSMRRSHRERFGGSIPLLAFCATKFIHLFLFVGLPVVVGGFGLLDILMIYVVATSVASIAFSVLVIGTHVSDEAAFPIPDENGRVSHDWATHQLVTAVDWMPESRIAALLSGGANAHTAHHLFPGYSHSHASALSALVIRAARENGLPYRSTSFAGMVGGHFRHLLALSA